MVARGIQQIQLVHLPTDPVQLAVEVLDSRRVAVLELGAQKPRYQGGFADAR